MSSTPFEQGLIGAGVGAFAATVGSVVVTFVIGRTSARSLRRDERVDKALEEILSRLEHGHWERATDYRHAVETLGTPPPAGSQDPRRMQLAEIAGELLEAARTLRLFVSRIDDDAYRALYTRYFGLAVWAAASSRTAARNGDFRASNVLVKPEAISEALRDLLQVTNSRLGHEYWDPGDDLPMPGKGGIEFASYPPTPAS